jgi:methylthioribose-1-phosphate isomerase
MKLVSTMKFRDQQYRTIWLDPNDDGCVRAIDQRRLPHAFEIAELRTLDDAYNAIADMLVRGAPLIGVAGAFGMYLAALDKRNHARMLDALAEAAHYLASSRPTAVNLAWALDRQLQRARALATDQPDAIIAELREGAAEIVDFELSISRNIGKHGVKLIRDIAMRKHGEPVQILTHCNAGWLCTVDLGTATAPIYMAHDAGVPIHVWVDETRPRNQGASLTAWELGAHGVPYTLIADNAGGHLMQQGEVDLVLVGTDRTTRGGDVANKIGTYLKALAAHDNGVPFFVAAPSSSIDWHIEDGRDIPIEERSADEVLYISGQSESGEDVRVRLAPANARVANYGFDVTPRRLITGLITERGICEANEKALLKLFPEMAEKRKLRAASSARASQEARSTYRSNESGRPPTRGSNESGRPPSNRRRAACRAIGGIELKSDSIRDEGVIKFDCRWYRAPALDARVLDKLISYRQRIHAINLIGVYPDGVGFGNISVRADEGFIISGTQTGHIANIAPEHFCIVEKYNINENWVDCSGPIKASSESLTHAVIYEIFPEANAVIHVHHAAAWRRLQNKFPTSGASVPYGTPAMAAEVRRLAKQSDLPQRQVLIMAGHEDGIISFGEDLEQAWTRLIAAMGAR